MKYQVFVIYPIIKMEFPIMIKEFPIMIKTYRGELVLV